MEKRELKFYETPAVEVVEMEVAQFLCVSDDGIHPPTDNGDWDL